MMPRLPFRLRLLVLLALAGVPGLLPRAGADASEDRQTLLQVGVPADDAGLLAFLRRRSLTEARRKEVERQVRDLGSRRYGVRQRATRALIAQGQPALPFLRQALKNPDVEVVRRAQRCIDKIRQGPGPEVPAAAVRLLARRNPPGAVAALLLYLPFADDDAVAEETLNALDQLARRSRHTDPALAAALTDSLPARRGAAGYVLARSGDERDRRRARRLLADPDRKVRWQTAYGLASARDSRAVPALIDLLREAEPPLAWQAEDLLTRIAGPSAPAAAVKAGRPEERRRAAAAWAAWWRRRGPKFDWAQVEVGPPGGALVAELETESVWEVGSGGRRRWELTDLEGPYDARPLPGGRFLVAEYTGQQVTERDHEGRIYWKARIDSPISCRRLPGGNTFIATPTQVLEVLPDGKEVYAHTLPKDRQPILAAEKLRGLDAVAVACHGGLLLLDTARPPFKSRTIDLGGGVAGDVQELPSGNLLVTVMFPKESRAVEIDSSGKKKGEVRLPAVNSVTRLPNGHLLGASNPERLLVEVDQSGKVVWKKRTVGRPVRVHNR